MPEPRRLGEFSPEFIESELGLINQAKAERKREVSDYIATERPQLKRPEAIPNELDLVRQVMAGRKKEAPVVKERGVLGELAAGFGRGALGVVAAPAEIADVAGEAIGWEALEKAGEAGVKAVEKYIEESPKLKRTESISKNILKNPELWKDPRWYSSIVGEGLPTILSMFIPGMAAAKAAKVAKLGAKGVRAARIAGGLTAGVGLEAAGAASDVRQYEEQTGEAIPISTKLQSVLGTGIVAGSLEYVPIFAIFGKAGAKKLVGRVLSGMTMEGTTEGAQGLVANAFAKAGYDADRNMVDGVVESIVGGVLLGGGMGAVSRVTNFKERVDETNPDEVSDILEQVEKETKVTPERAVELTEAEKRQATIDREFEARRTPAERQAEIEAAMPATPMTTISEETTRLAEEGIKPEAVEPVPEEIVPEKIPLVPEAMPATLRAMGMKPVPVEPIVEKPVVEEKIVEPKAPKIEIPTLTDTTQAIAFGEKATPEQIAELKRLRKESEARYDVLVKEDKLDEAGEEAFRGQLYREAYEAKEKPKEPFKIVPEKITGYRSEEVSGLGERDIERVSSFEISELGNEDIIDTLIDRGIIKEKSEVNALIKNLKAKGYNEVVWLSESPKAVVDVYSTEEIPISKESVDKYDIKDGVVISDLGIDGKLVAYKKGEPTLTPVKPPTPKPPKPTPLEAAREEIEAKPIPEVAWEYNEQFKKDLATPDQAFWDWYERYPAGAKGLKKEFGIVLNKSQKGEWYLARKPKIEALVEKEAWKMDRREFTKIFGRKTGLSEWAQLVDEGKITNEQFEEAKRLAKKKAEYVMPDIEYAVKHKSNDLHVGIIRKAISEGKTIPPEVLRDYPDLKKQKPTEPIGPTVPKSTMEEKVTKLRVEKKQKLAEPTVATVPEPKQKPGMAWIKNKQKSILSAREITRGKNKGKYEVVLTKGRDEEGNIIPGAKKIVAEKAIITMPEEKVEAPLKKEPTKAKPFEPDLKTLPLGDINVKIKAIKESTGEIITVDENAKVAVESNNKEIEKYYELLACL